VEKDDRVVSVSASIGVASTHASGHGLQRLCMDADAALYRAKRAGRNCVMSDAEVDDTLVDA
jgi:diguanylate cyclase (GGDEF)-like protein